MSDKTKIQNLMRDIRRQQKELPKRKFPKKGSFANTKEYVEAYFKLNLPDPYFGEETYANNFTNLSTNPLSP